MKYTYLFVLAGVLFLFLILNITQCKGHYCRDDINRLYPTSISRERSLLVTKHNPSTLNKALDAF
jgi:hypothetical protein